MYQSNYKSMDLNQLSEEALRLLKSNDPYKLEKLKFLKKEAMLRPNKFLELLEG